MDCVGFANRGRIRKLTGFEIGPHDGAMRFATGGTCCLLAVHVRTAEDVEAPSIDGGGVDAFRLVQMDGCSAEHALLSDAEALSRGRCEQLGLATNSLPNVRTAILEQNHKEAGERQAEPSHEELNVPPHVTSRSAGGVLSGLGIMTANAQESVAECLSAKKDGPCDQAALQRQRSGKREQGNEIARLLGQASCPWQRLQDRTQHPQARKEKCTRQYRGKHKLRSHAKEFCFRRNHGRARAMNDAEGPHGYEKECFTGPRWAHRIAAGGA